MDRNKPSGSSRSAKTKVGVPHAGSELYALGTKSSTGRDDKSKVISSVKAAAASSDRKRESSISLNVTVASKKPKLGGNNSGTTPRLCSESSTTSSREQWEQLAVDCESSDLVSSVLTAGEHQGSDTSIGFLCGAIRNLSSRSKIDPMLALSLMYLAKLRPALFSSDPVTSALISILKRDNQHAFKARNNPTAHVLAANLLARGYHDKKSWPEVFLKIYIDDAANERNWVDNPDCTPFMENICTAFGTRVPPKSMLQPELSALSQSCRDSSSLDDDSGGDNSMQSDITRGGGGCGGGDLQFDCPIRERYSNNLLVESHVLDAVKEQLNRRQQQDCSTRNFLKFLCTTSGICEVRAMSISRLELWIHNGKLMKPAQELLTYICYNVTGHGSRDHEVLATLVKMRLKTKPLINIYMSCFKEMLNLQPDILYIVLKLVVQNELSNARNPNNMGMLANMFQTKPDESARHLAEIYQEFLLQREDCLRTLRVFLRELVKMLRYDMNLVEFCKTFLTNRPELTVQMQQSEFKDRIFHSVVDLVCLCMLLTVSPQVREACVSVRAGRDMKSSPAIMTAFYSQISQIQLDVLTWMHSIVPKLFGPQPAEYSYALHKILLLDAPEQYSKSDQWPPEPERALLMRVASETPVLEDSIIRIILIGISKDNPFTVPDTVEVLEQTIRRASTLRAVDYPAIEANKLEIIEFLFSMAEYHHPDNIQLPIGYEPPKLAISSLYWKAWNILLMLSAHNPGTFGAFCWDRYPMLRSLMEMCITNQFHDVKIAEEELQVAALERSEILEFESHLAAATSKVVINEQNSLLLSQLMIMDPMGVPRRPPNQFLEQLQQLNGSHKLGHLLCRSRKPDLLLDIIQRQGTSQAMPWLADLVQNSEGDFNHLPVQCLCEFLLSNSANMNADNNRDVKLLEYLRKLLQDESYETQMCCEVLDYFLHRLSSTVKQSRFLAINGLKLLLQIFHKPGEDENLTSDWLLRYLPQIHHFTSIRQSIVAQLRAACQIENNPELVMIYIQFIATHTLHDVVPDMLEHVMDMSQLIVERTTIFQQIVPIPSVTSLVINETLADSRLQTLNCLFVMFHNYLIKLREHKAPYEWAEYSDLLMVHFEDGVQLPIHLNIIHAFVILLTHSTVTLPNSIPILDYWFPASRYIPQAFTIDTNEQVQLLPDWLKLKMIRSPVDRLVDAAMYDLTPDQIVLFVQNFGTPISSMTKLLALLDTAVIENQEAVANAIMNKTYLGHLIEIQQARGAKNGHITLQALKLTSGSECEMEFVEPAIQNLQSVSLDQFQSISTAERADSRELIELISYSPKFSSMQYRRAVQKLTKRESTISKQKRSNVRLEQQIVEKTLLQLLKVIEQPHNISFFDSIYNKSHVCTLLRSLFAINNKHQKLMLRVIDKLINILRMSDRTLSKSTFLPILLNKRKAVVRKLQNNISTDQMEKQNFAQILLSASDIELETRGRKFVNDMINNRQADHLVEAIVSFLNSLSYKIKQDESLFEYASKKKGILIDWLAEVDSELIMVNTQLQMDLLFTSNLNEFRFYMVSLLCNQAQWATIVETIAYLLTSYKASYDCSSVLNFIEAIIQNPKLWQGREKATPKHEQFEHVLKLNHHQINVFTEYVLNECLVEANLNQSEYNVEKLNIRLELFLKVINRDSFNLRNLVNYVKNYPCPENLKFKYYQQLYLMVPVLKFADEELNDVYNSDIQNFKGCKADKIAHYIITTTASMRAQKDQILASDTELEARKLAATHPALFLRQLSVLASLLQGKAHMSIGVLRSEQHLARFHQVLGILELLDPLVFDDAYKQGLHTALDCYFTLIKHHSRIREVYGIMCRLIEFLQTYISTNPTTALAFVEQYTELLQELVSKYRNYSSLHQLAQGLSLLKRRAFSTLLNEEETKSENIELDEQFQHSVDIDEPSASSSTVLTSSTAAAVADIDNRGVASFAVTGPLVSKPHQMSPHIKSLIDIVQRSNVEDIIMPPLKEIESLTFKRGGFLDGLFDRLLELIFSPNILVRSTAHSLLVRHLKHHPGNRDINKTAVNAYIQSLSDSNSMIASSALENLIEVVICLQEFSPVILRTAFDLGIQSRLNSAAQIKKCLQTLKLQHAC